MTGQWLVIPADERDQVVADLQPQRSLTVGQAAERLHVSRQTVKRRIRAGQLPATVTEGGHYRVSEAAVRDYLAGGR